MNNIFKQLRPALVALGLFTIITGIIYPLLVTGIAQAVFPDQANGSLIEQNGEIIGSELIGQNFYSPAYFWGRVSSTGNYPYNGSASSGSNYGVLNPALIGEDGIVDQRATALSETAPENSVVEIPVDLVTSSASGLDPHISPAAANYQISRVAQARGVSEAIIRQLVEDHTEKRTFGLLGEARVNVLRLNLALDEAFGKPD